MRPMARFRYAFLSMAFVPLIWVKLKASVGMNAMSEDAAAGQARPFLPEGSPLPWAFALLSAGVFVTAAVLLLDRQRIRLKSLLVAGLFTATIGIALLLGFQRLAAYETDFEVSGNATAVIMHYLLVAIAYCYQLTQQNDGNIWIEALAYTMSVGLCEEITKLLPVLFRLQRDALSGTDARILGFVSGVGFGVAEGVHYSQHFYNGSAAGTAYLVRFVSCVVFHGFATASAASLVVRHRVDDAAGWSYLGKLVWAILPVMVLHALYDTWLGHQDLVLWALCAAVGMFLLLMYQIETKRWREKAGSRYALLYR